MSVDEEKIEIEWQFFMMLHNFCFNGNVLFELNMFGIILHHSPLQNGSIWRINGMGMSYVIQQDIAVDYKIIT